MKITNIAQFWHCCITFSVLSIENLNFFLLTSPLNGFFLAFWKFYQVCMIIFLKVIDATFGITTRKSDHDKKKGSEVNIIPLMIDWCVGTVITVLYNFQVCRCYMSQAFIGNSTNIAATHIDTLVFLFRHYYINLTFILRYDSIYNMIIFY